LEKLSQSPIFWENSKEAEKTTKELSNLREKIDGYQKIKNETKELLELKELAGLDEKMLEEIEEKVSSLEQKILKEESKIFLSGKYDKGNAILSLFAGAGGQDAQDWTTMLLRMYERFCQSRQFKIKILHQSFGEGGGPEGRIGTKSVTMEIKGDYAYGILKKEAGVHRLVRISPFSAQSLRHTSFALVEILPEIPKIAQDEIEIKPEDLKLEAFRASGPGGQYVNKRESAVRITHIPTGVKVSCQSERLQGLNREKAKDLLYAKLYQLQLESHKKEIAKNKKNSSLESWGSQIRSYILHPYKLVKDLRTNLETNKVEDVLNGNLNEFIKAEIKLNK
jgi:peptide chain release factor 2